MVSEEKWGRFVENISINGTHCVNRHGIIDTVGNRKKCGQGCLRSMEGEGKRTISVYVYERPAGSGVGSPAGVPDHGGTAPARYSDGIDALHGLGNVHVRTVGMDSKGGRATRPCYPVLHLSGFMHGK